MQWTVCIWSLYWILTIVYTHVPSLNQGIGHFSHSRNFPPVPFQWIHRSSHYSDIYHNFPLPGIHYSNLYLEKLVFSLLLIKRHHIACILLGSAFFTQHCEIYPSSPNYFLKLLCIISQYYFEASSRHPIIQFINISVGNSKRQVVSKDPKLSHLKEIPQML